MKDEEMLPKLTLWGHCYLAIKPKTKGNDRPISLMNLEVLNKTLANEIQQYVKRITHHVYIHQVCVCGLFQIYKADSAVEKQLV